MSTALVPSATLALRIGRSRNVRAVASLKEASDLWCAKRDASMVGASRMPEVTVVDTTTGTTVARVSYNGRVWSPEPYPACTVLYDTFTAE
jgi:hypothetical protein